MSLVKSSYEKLKEESKKKTVKKNVKKDKYEDVKQAFLLSQGIILGSILISFVASWFVPEMFFLCRLFFIVLTFIMSVSNYLIYKKIGLSIVYFLVGVGFIVGTLLGV